MSEEILEKLCDIIVDVIHESYPSRIFLVKVSQAKNGNIYLIVRKKRGRFVGDEIEEFQERIYNIVPSVFNFFCIDNDQLGKNYLTNFKLIKSSSGHHFHFVLLCKDKYVNDKFL